MIFNLASVYIQNTKSGPSYFTKSVLRPTQTRLGKSPQLLAHVYPCGACSNKNRDKMFYARMGLSSISAFH